MSEFQNNIFNQQMSNTQIDKPQMNLQINHNEILNNQNQIQNTNLPPFNQFQNQNFNLNNYLNNISNTNQNINMNNNNFPNQNINNMNKIELNFDDLNENIGNQNQTQNPVEMNINQKNININNPQSQQEEKMSHEEDNAKNNNNISNNNNTSNISSSKQNKKEENQLTPNKKLENKFSFLYRIDENIRYQSQKQGVMEKEKYELQVKKIADFDTIEDFWSIFQHLRKPDSCIPGIEYFMFKEPIKPLWEDENNKNGGRFSIKLKHGYTTIIWEEMIFALIGGILPKEMKDQINGIVVTSRKEFNTLQIWFKNYDDKITEDLEQCIRDLLVIPSEVKIEKRQFNKKDNVNNNNSNKNINNNKSGGYHGRGYNSNNNYDNSGYGNYYKEHKKSKHQSNKNK
jgi:hypothetical protein